MARTVATWVLTLLLAALFAAAGAGKFGAEATANFQKFGYGDGFRIFIGLAELAGGIGLLVPGLAFWAGSGLIVIMLGAVYTHFAVEINPAFPAVVALLLAALTFLRYPRALLLSHPPAAAGGAQPESASRPAA